MYSNKTSTSAIVLFLIAALVVFIGYGSAIDGKWFKNSNISTWYNSWGKGETVQTTDNDQNADNTQNNSQNNSGNQNGSDVTPVQTGNNEEFVIGESQGTGLTLLCAPIDELTSVSLVDAPASYVAVYSLTVTAYPVSAVLPELDWLTSWASNPSSWTTGKNIDDYVVIIPTNPGAATATVYCLQPFGDPVIITVCAHDNNSLSASVTCNYVDAPVGLKYFFDNNSSSLYDLSLDTSTSSFDIIDLSGFISRGRSWSLLDLGSSEVLPVFSSGSVSSMQNSIVANSETVTMSVSSAFVSALSNAGLTPCSANTNITIAANTSYYDFIGLLFSDYLVSNNTINSELYNKFVTACHNLGNSTAFTLTISANMTYGGSVSVTRAFTINSDSAAFTPTSLNVSQSSLVFFTPIANN